MTGDRGHLLISRRNFWSRWLVFQNGSSQAPNQWRMKNESYLEVNTHKSGAKQFDGSYRPLPRFSNTASADEWMSQSRRFSIMISITAPVQLQIQLLEIFGRPEKKFVFVVRSCSRSPSILRIKTWSVPSRLGPTIFLTGHISFSRE
jgi:hypothetical protein